LKNKAHYIEECIARGENLTQDFKFAINDSKKIAKSLVAFSNTIGGRLLIGVKDNGSIVGVRTDEEFHMIQAAAGLYCKPEISFETKTWIVNGKKVLEIIIPESKCKPHMALDDHKKWLALVRVEDENIAANSVQIKVWLKQKRNEGIKISDNEPGRKLLSYLNKNEYISLSGFLKLGSISYRQAVNILSDLIVLQLIEMIHIESGFVYQLKQKNIDLKNK
jgi:predicted HTH transcriptional regulator